MHTYTYMFTVVSKASRPSLKVQVGFLFIPFSEIAYSIKDLNNTKKSLILKCIDEIKNKFYENDKSDGNHSEKMENIVTSRRDSFLNTTNSLDLEELHIISPPDFSAEKAVTFNEKKNTKIDGTNNANIDLVSISEHSRHKADKETSTTHHFEVLHTLCSAPLSPYPLTSSVYIPTYNDFCHTTGQITTNHTDTRLNTPEYLKTNGQLEVPSTSFVQFLRLKISKKSADNVQFLVNEIHQKCIYTYKNTELDGNRKYSEQERENGNKKCRDDHSLNDNNAIEILKKGTKIRIIKKRFLDKLHTVEGKDVDINDLYSDFLSQPQLDFKGDTVITIVRFLESSAIRYIANSLNLNIGDMDNRVQVYI